MVVPGEDVEVHCPRLAGLCRLCSLRVPEESGNAKITKEYRSIVVNKKVSRLHVAMNQPIDVKVAIAGCVRARSNVAEWCLLESLKGLFQDTTDDFFVESSWPLIPHNVGDTACVHETHSDVQLMAVNPGTTDTKHVGVFRERHELSLVLQEAESTGREAIEVEDLESARDRWCAIGRLILGGIDDRRRSETDGRPNDVVRRVITATVPQPRTRREKGCQTHLYSCQLSSTAPMNILNRESVAAPMDGLRLVRVSMVKES